MQFLEPSVAHRVYLKSRDFRETIFLDISISFAHRFCRGWLICAHTPLSGGHPLRRYACTEVSALCLVFLNFWGSGLATSVYHFWVNFLGVSGAVVHPLVRSFSGQRVVPLHSTYFQTVSRPIVFDSGRERWSLRLRTILVSRSIDGSFVL